MKYMVKCKKRNDFGVKGMKKGVRKAVQKVSNSTAGNIAKTIGKNYRKAAINNVGLAKRLLKRKGVGSKLTGAYLAATTPLATALGGTALNLKAGYKGAKKMITGKDSAIKRSGSYYRDSLVVMAYRKRQLRDAKMAYIKAKKRSLARRDASIRRYNDADLKAMVQQLKSQFIKIKDGLKQFAKGHPSLTRILKVLGAFIIMVSTESPEAAKDMKKYDQIKRNLEEGIIDLERENDGSFGMSKIPNKYMLGLRFCIALVGKIVGVALIVSAARRNKKTDSRCRRDSRAMLVIAKHRYHDALRRYQDSVLDTLKQKFDNVFQKIKKTVKEYIKAFPLLSSLTASLMSMSSVYTTYGVVAGAPKLLSYLQYQSKIIDQSDFSVYGKAGLKARNVLTALYAVAKQIIKAIIKLKIAKGISRTLQEE